MLRLPGTRDDIGWRPLLSTAQAEAEVRVMTVVPGGLEQHAS